MRDSGEDGVWIPLGIELCGPWGFRGTSESSRDSICLVFTKVLNGEHKDFTISTENSVLLSPPGV